MILQKVPPCLSGWSPTFTLPVHLLSGPLLSMISFHLTCSIFTLILTLVPILGATEESTDDPLRLGINLSEMISNLTDINPRRAPMNVTKPLTGEKGGGIHKTLSKGGGVPKDSPRALVIASSIAAVCILVFFVLAYLWHTHQLDSRARKLAIRLAADAEHGMRCRSCQPPKTRSYARPVSESSHEQNHYEALTTEEERGPGSDGGRSSVAVSESEAGDSEDVFEPIRLPRVNERGRGGARGGRGAHRKWSRSRKSSSGTNLDKRDSAVTDKEILTHFASRRHSTFFI